MNCFVLTQQLRLIYYLFKNYLKIVNNVWTDLIDINQSGNKFDR